MGSPWVRILFFCRRMARRGFEHSEIKKIAFRHFKKLSHRGDFKDFARAADRSKVYRMPIVYSSAANTKTLTRALYRHRKLVAHLGQVGLAWRTQAPRFLELYRHN